MLQSNKYDSIFSATHAMKNFIITTNEACKTSKIYNEVSKLIYKLMESGVVNAGKGYCISMSDIIYSLLIQRGIPCSLVECQLTITHNNSDTFYLVGFSNLKDVPNGMDTHVVVVTNTEPALLIDVSISHLLPNNMQGVIDVLEKKNHGIFANIETEQVSLTYQEKRKESIAVLHQKSIVDRINTDLTIFKNLRVLKYAVFIALLISSINAFRGIYEYYEVYIRKDNYWGPYVIQEMFEKLDNIEKKIEK